MNLYFQSLAKPCDCNSSVDLSMYFQKALCEKDPKWKPNTSTPRSPPGYANKSLEDSIKFSVTYQHLTLQHKQRIMKTKVSRLSAAV